jgi:hypothetical protein
VIVTLRWCSEVRWCSDVDQTTWQARKQKANLENTVELVRFQVCFLKVISLSLTNLKITRVYMIVNFRTRGINSDMHKLAQIPMLIKKNL